MSDYKVPYTRILEIKEHPNAHSLEIAIVYDWQVIVKKGFYKKGDCIIYVPIDSVLNNIHLETKLFGPNAKIKLNKNRVRQIRIRNYVSQGMIINPLDVREFLHNNVLDESLLESDLSEILGITKYEPPERGLSYTQSSGESPRKREHPLFHKFNGLSNIKWMPKYFEEGEQVVVEEKVHGSNARLGLLPFHANTLWKKIKKFLHLVPQYEYVYGSNNVDISSKFNYKGYYGEDIYGQTIKKLDLFSKLKENEIFYGEIIGPGVQKNYSYGLKDLTFVLFDVKVIKDGKGIWLDPEAVEQIAKERGMEFVPVIYKGLYNKELVYTFTSGPSLYCPEQKVREGIVVKARENYSLDGNKRAVKWINEEYLDDKTNSDFH